MKTRTARLTFALALLATLSLVGCTPVAYSGGYGYAPPPPHYYAPPRPLPYYGAAYGYGAGYGYAPPAAFYAPHPRPYGASYRVHVGAGAGAGYRGQYQQPCTPRHARPMRLR